MYQTHPPCPRAGPAALALVEARPDAGPVPLVASWLQVVTSLGRGLSVLGLNPCSHGCKPLPGARLGAAVKPLGKWHGQGVCLAAGTRLSAAAQQHQGAATAMGLGWGGWARGFPMAPATAGSHGSKGGTDLQSWCMGGLAACVRRQRHGVGATHDGSAPQPSQGHPGLATHAMLCGQEPHVPGPSRAAPTWKPRAQEQQQNLVAPCSWLLVVLHSGHIQLQR